MIAVLLERTTHRLDQHAAGALAALTWLDGLSSIRPICGDDRPVTPDRVAFESRLAGDIASRGVGLVGERHIVGEYAAGVVDAMLWAYGNEPIEPLI